MTAILYANPAWRPEHGGQLRIWLPTSSSATTEDAIAADGIPSQLAQADLGTDGQISSSEASAPSNAIGTGGSALQALQQQSSAKISTITGADHENVHNIDVSVDPQTHNAANSIEQEQAGRNAVFPSTNHQSAASQLDNDSEQATLHPNPATTTNQLDDHTTAGQVSVNDTQAVGSCQESWYVAALLLCFCRSSETCAFKQNKCSTTAAAPLSIIYSFLVMTRRIWILSSLACTLHLASQILHASLRT